MKQKFTIEEWLKDKNVPVEKRSGTKMSFLYQDPTTQFLVFRNEDDLTLEIYNTAGGRWCHETDHSQNLMIVTDEPDLTKFETLLGEIIDSWENESPFNVPEELKKDAQKLEECLCGIEKGDGPLAWHLGKIAGLQEVMTIIPHWKKCGVNFLDYQIRDGKLYHDDWCIPLEDLFNKLPMG